MLATDVADYLVEKGVPFRQAHETVGAIVRWCVAEDKTLDELVLTDWRRFSPLFDADIAQRLTLEAAVDRRSSYGGTAGTEVDRQLRDFRP